MDIIYIIPCHHPRDKDIILFSVLGMEASAVSEELAQDKKNA